jgi:transposase-like protein
MTAAVGFVEGAVAPGSVVFTDGWRGYVPLKKKGYDHRPNTQGAGPNAPNLLPRAHRAFSNLKRWLMGTHHGVGRTHLPHEFVFRFNRRHTPMAAFQTLLGLAGQHTPTTYKMLYRAEPTG